MKPKISIVVPVYKVEKYIDKCVQSLIQQTYNNIEIILVDDGSPDRCPEICDRYALKDSRIKVIHKSNGGLSDARNVGLKASSGKYVLFVDSDDFIELNTCERFLNIIGDSNPDIVVGNANRIENEKVIPMKHKTNTRGQIITGEQYLLKELKFGTMYMAAWLNLYNKDFLLNNDLEFKVGFLHEDEHFTPRAFLKAKKVIGTDITFYNYLIRPGSITTVKNKEKNAQHMIQICEELEEIYKEIEDVQLRKLLNNDLVNKYLNTFQVAGLYKRKYSHLINKNFLKGKALTKKNKLKVLLFLISKRLYFYVNNLSKVMK